MSLKTLAARIEYLGGDQLGRINSQKLRSFQEALKNDYNTRYIKTKYHDCWPCLINIDNLKPDYDKKIISVEKESQLKAGDTFECLDDGTHWMIYLPYLHETAYLRSEIIRCRYQLEINGKKYWIYFQGPTETDLRWQMKNNINFNELNLSGTIYIEDNPDTKDYFKRFTRIKIDGHVWEVQVTDSISVPGIIELEVQEYYDNSIEELPKIEKDPAISVDPEPMIVGATLVKPGEEKGYLIDNTLYKPGVEWHIDDNPRVEVKNVKENGRICTVKIHEGTVKSFTLWYGDIASLAVNVDWVKPVIQGPQTVYPYDSHTYWIKNPQNLMYSFDTYPSDESIAKVIETGKDYCKVEITAGKKGMFTLYAYDETGQEYSLDIKIASL